MYYVVDNPEDPDAPLPEFDPGYAIVPLCLWLLITFAAGFALGVAVS